MPGVELFYWCSWVRNAWLYLHHFLKHLKRIFEFDCPRSYWSLTLFCPRTQTFRVNWEFSTDNLVHNKTFRAKKSLSNIFELTIRITASKNNSWIFSPLKEKRSFFVFFGPLDGLDWGWGGRIWQWAFLDLNKSLLWPVTAVYHLVGVILRRHTRRRLLRREKTTRTNTKNKP